MNEREAELRRQINEVYKKMAKELLISFVWRYIFGKASEGIAKEGILELMNNVPISYYRVDDEEKACKKLSLHCEAPTSSVGDPRAIPQTRKAVEIMLQLFEEKGFLNTDNETIAFMRNRIYELFNDFINSIERLARLHCIATEGEKVFILTSFRNWYDERYVIAHNEKEKEELEDKIREYSSAYLQKELGGS